MIQDVCLDFADASLASGLELKDGRIQLARQNSIAEFDDGTLTGVDTRIESAGGIISPDTHPGFCYMQDGDDNGNDYIHWALPGDGEHAIIKLEGFAGGLSLTSAFQFVLVALAVDGNPFAEDDWIIWLHQILDPADHVLDHNIRRINKIATVVLSDTNADIAYARLRTPLWVKIARSGNDWTISYRTRWDASFTNDVTFTNANIVGGHVWYRNTDGNRQLIDWIRNNTVAFVTTSPVASWTGLTGAIDTTNAVIDMLQIIDNDLGFEEGDLTILANGTDRVEFRFNGGSWMSFTAWIALGVITPTTIDIRLISDGTQQIKILNSIIGISVPDFPDVGNVTEDDTVDDVTGTYKENIVSDVRDGIFYGEDATEKEGTLAVTATSNTLPTKLKQIPGGALKLAVVP